jgi:hypothetical protein
MPFHENGKARGYLEMLNDIPLADRPEFASTIPDMKAFEDSLLEAGCPLNEIDQLITELEFYRSPNSKVDDPAVELMRVLSESIRIPDENSAIDLLESTLESRKPRFKTGLASLDQMTGGGCYGLTTVAGDAKAGKTLFAFSTAVEAALSPEAWKVVYFNAELDRNEAIMAVIRKCEGKIPPELGERMTLITPDYTFQPRDAISRIREAIELGDEKVLVVLDSINALIDLSSDGSGDEVIDYWSAAALWRNFAVRATKNSGGRIAFLAVSETNRAGGIKGAALEYKSDLCVKICKDDQNPTLVDIDVMLSRSTPSGPLGTFYRDWLNCKFKQCDNTFK